MSLPVFELADDAADSLAFYFRLDASLGPSNMNSHALPFSFPSTTLSLSYMISPPPSLYLPVSIIPIWDTSPFPWHRDLSMRARFRRAT